MPLAQMRRLARLLPPLRYILHLDKVCVYAAALHQFGMRALLGYTSLIDDIYAVGIVDRAQAVGYDYRCAALQQSRECILHELFALGVECRRGLVEDQYRRGSSNIARAMLMRCR